MNNDDIFTGKRINNSVKSDAKEQLTKLAPMKEQSKALDSIDVMVGRPEVRNIPITMLRPAPEEWNIFPKASQEKVQQISESIRQYGMFHNVTVWEQPDRTFMILGGHTRVDCLKHLDDKFHDSEHPDKWTSVPCLVYKREQITETDAHRIVIVSNTDQRELSSQTISQAYFDLYKLEKKKAFYGSYINSLASAAKQANTSRAQFAKVMSLRKLIKELSDLVSNKKDAVIPVSVGYHLSKLPERLQMYVYEKSLYKKMSVKMAEQVAKCHTEEEIDEKILSIETAPKYYKYVCPVKRKKTVDETAVCLFFPKTEQKELMNQLVEAVAQSSIISQEVKDKLTKIVKESV